MLSEAEVLARKDRLTRLYKAARDPGCEEVDEILKIHSLRPDTLDGHLRLYRSVMRCGEGLSVRERELIAVAVSAYNACHY